jgi:hypothetical protein
MGEALRPTTKSRSTVGKPQVRFGYSCSAAGKCAHGGYFLLHSREKPSPEGSSNIKKSAVSRGENIIKKKGQKSYNYGEIIKKNYISLFGGKPARGLPMPPPTPPRREIAHLTRGKCASAMRGRDFYSRN